MDIEGGEGEFLRSEEFKHWIRDNRICWLLELHSQVSPDLLWDDIPRIELDTKHVLIQPDPDLLAHVSDEIAKTA
jgi:hypothetical protein